jgi:hypothetical protein
MFFHNSTRSLKIVIEAPVFFKTHSHTVARVRGVKKWIKPCFEFLAIFEKSTIF